MSDNSKIEWCDASWNPVRGCTRVSSGCKNCYAERFAERFRGVKGHPFEQGFDVRLVPEALDLPLHWRRPRRVFVNSMSDLFHEDVPDSFIDEVFARILAGFVLENSTRHIYQLLTKRAERMRTYFSASPVALLQRWAKAGDGRIHIGDGDVWFSEYVGDQCAALWDERGMATTPVKPWSHPENLFPLRDVWLGVSVEDRRARSRIAVLEQTPAAVRYVSCEPLLEDLGDLCLQETNMDWLIVGGESGPGARPCDLAWIRSLVGQCKAAGATCFVKQLGANVEERHGSRVPVPVRIHLRDRKGSDPAEWPENLRVREMPTTRSTP